MKSNTPLFLNLFWFSTCQLVSAICLAQGTGGGGDPDVPVDGGMSLLLVAGVAYGIKQISRCKKKCSYPES